MIRDPLRLAGTVLLVLLLAALVASLLTGCGYTGGGGYYDPSPIVVVHTHVHTYVHHYVTHVHVYSRRR